MRVFVALQCCFLSSGRGRRRRSHTNSNTAISCSLEYFPGGQELSNAPRRNSSRKSSNVPELRSSLTVGGAGSNH